VVSNGDDFDEFGFDSENKAKRKLGKHESTSGASNARRSFGKLADALDGALNFGDEQISDMWVALRIPRSRSFGLA
jgi:hypothetical protein